MKARREVFKKNLKVEGTGNDAGLSAGLHGSIDFVDGGRNKFAGVTLSLFPVPSTLHPWVSNTVWGLFSNMGKY